MRLSKVRRRCGWAAYSVLRIKSIVLATLYSAGFHSKSRKVVRYQRSDCSLLVTRARSVRCLGDILLPSSLPNLSVHSSMKARRAWRLAASGMVRLAAPSYLPAEIAASGSRRHSAVRNWPLRLFMARSRLFSAATGAAAATVFLLLALAAALPCFWVFLAAMAGAMVQAIINAAIAILFFVIISNLLIIWLFVKISE